MGTNDDWSYVRTALDLARTGRVLYNGWATAMLGWQVFWGALFIKVFGFSFLAVRLSTLPCAMVSAYLLFQILIRFGLTSPGAVLGTLTVALSPALLPLSASFMSDVPGFLFVLTCLYCCLRSVDAASSRASICWLALAAIGSVAGGTARQIVWLGALVMAPSAAWLLRKRQGVLIGTAVLWVVSLGSIAACMYWFARQPYSVPEQLISGAITPHMILHLLRQLLYLCLTILLLVLPALSTYISVLRRAPGRLLIFVLASAFLLLLVVQAVTHQAFAPWMADMVTEYGVMGSGFWENLGRKPVVLTPGLRFVLTATVLVAASAWIVSLSGHFRGPQSGNEAKTKPSWCVILTLLVPFSACYFILLIPRAMSGLLWDRYLVPLLPVFIILVLRYHQDRIQARPPLLSFAVLSLFSLYGVAATHDYFATGRARLLAASRVQQSGIPRTAIQGGFEYDGWTQLVSRGYVNDERLRIPPGAYHKVEPALLPEQCRIWYWDRTSAVVPRYFVVFSPQSCLIPSAFQPVSYSTWLPPFTRQIYIEQSDTRR